ncbi:MAG: cysteine--tRNA ligase [Candidatus Kapabacteria bacterium]|nr:cysteine--tRNA ligase [Candidatus Kapabacteria bacterium]
MQLHLYNTLTKRIDLFTPLDAEVVRIYSCGPTVYDVAHLGNMRAFVFTDVLQRVLREVGGYPVRWVMNVTDVDDKTIRDSSVGSAKWRSEMGQQSDDLRANLRAYTGHFEQEFRADLTSLGIEMSHFAQMPRATDYIGQMQDLIREIIAAGYGYTSEGSVYFDVAAYSKKHTYGRLFTIDTENFREGVRIDADEYDRESVSDFVLWKGRKDDEPYWDFALNGEDLPGRPGWHIECSAMSKELLGLPFDIHTGGVDLRFPHHEDELAQCCAGYHVHDQARFWMHNEFLEVEGKKMSKSLGNFFTLRDLMKQGCDPLDVRLTLMLAHYRAVLNFTFDSLRAASVARGRVQNVIWDLIDVAGVPEAADKSSMPLAVAEAFADDLNVPQALARMYEYLAANADAKNSKEHAQQVLNALRSINNVLAVWSFSPRPALVVPNDVRSIADQRWAARTAKDWAEADRLRSELGTLGWSMKDGKDDYTLEPLS